MTDEDASKQIEVMRLLRTPPTYHRSFPRAPDSCSGFEDEAYGLRLRHTCAGLLSMANSGPDSNRSQFMVTLGPAPQLDGKQVIIGRLVSGAMHLQVRALPMAE